MTKKPSREFISKQAAKTFKHSAKESVEFFTENQKLSPVVLKSLSNV